MKKEKKWHYGIKKWLFLKTLSNIIVFLGMMLPIYISGFLTIYYNENENALFFSQLLLNFGISLCILVICLKIYVSKTEKEKEKMESKKYEKFNKKFFILTTIFIFLLIFCMVNITTILFSLSIIKFTPLTIIYSIIYLIVSYIYLFGLGKLSIWIEQIANKKLNQFQNQFN